MNFPGRLVVGVAIYLKGMLTLHSYCVIVSRPRREKGVSNADAVAAALLNMAYSYAGPRQTIVQGFDLRSDTHRAHVTRFAGDLCNTTPLFYSRSDNVFTTGGLVSLQILLDVVSQVVPSPQPVDEAIVILTEFPKRHELRFVDAWADVLEMAESPEYRSLQSGAVAKVPVKFTPSVREPVRAEDIVGSSRNPSAGMSGSQALRTAGLSPEEVARQMRTPASSREGLTQTQTSFMTGMTEYADVSVFDKMSKEREHGGESTSSSSQTIEQRILTKIPNVRHVSEGKQIQEREITKDFSTDPASTEEQIKRARFERAQLTKQWRGK